MADNEAKSSTSSAGSQTVRLAHPWVGPDGKVHAAGSDVKVDTPTARALDAAGYVARDT